MQHLRNQALKKSKNSGTFLSKRYKLTYRGRRLKIQRECRQMFNLEHQVVKISNWTNESYNFLILLQFEFRLSKVATFNINATY